MFTKDRQSHKKSVTRSFTRYFRTMHRLPSFAVTMVLLVLALAGTAVSRTDNQQRGLGVSLDTADLIALRKQCGSANALEDSLQLVRKHICSTSRSGSEQLLAFEENRLFIYAMADISGGQNSNYSGDSLKGLRCIRRFFLLKPSTFVVEDIVLASNPKRPVRWLLYSTAEPKIEDRLIRLSEAETEIAGQSLLPANARIRKASRSRKNNLPQEFRIVVTPKQSSGKARFLNVFHLHSTADQDQTSTKMVSNDEQMKLTVATQDRVFQLTLPSELSLAGKIEINDIDGNTLLPDRVLPSGVMPHGPEGVRLLERWDSPYRGNQLPGWDVGRPCSHLVKAVEDGTFRPGRAIVFGCGSGTNAVYLARKGFEVTGVDVAPTALAIAQNKAQKEGVKVDWVMADVLSLPKMEPFDLIFDRGCYHHICLYNSAGYVEALRRLSHPGTQAMILAGSPADGNSGGPPRVKKETISNDFSTLFEFVELGDIHFDTRDPKGKGPSAWSIHLRRKDE